MTRILLIVPSNMGTIGLCSLNLYKALLQRHDINVQCVIVHKYLNGYPEFENCLWCVTSTASGLKKVFALVSQVWWLRKIKRDFCPDISISTLFGCSTINILSGGRDKKIGIFHSPHTQVRSKGRFEYWTTLLSYKVLYPKLDKLYCVSNEIRMSLIRSFHEIDPQKIDVVYNIHDVERIRTLAAEEINDKIEADIFSHPVLLYCGRLDDNKAPDRLLNAFLASDLPEEVQLVYIGDDTDGIQSKLQEMAKSMERAQNVHFFGRRTNPYKYMKHAAVLVSCSYSEGLPGVIIESLILGTPVVTTNSSEGVWEIFSCQEKYTPELDSIYPTANGIISSNLAAIDNSKYNVDVYNLRMALEKVLLHEEKYCRTFSFLPNIEAKNVLLKYTNIL